MVVLLSSVRIELMRTRFVLLNFDVDLYLRNSFWPNRVDVLVLVPHRAHRSFELGLIEYMIKELIFFVNE